MISMFAAVRSACALRRLAEALRGCLAAVALFSLLYTAAQAGTLGVPSLSPQVATAGQVSAVTVSVSITDPKYIAGSGNVQRLKADGTVQAVVGTLHDDGLNGDAVAGDKIYSLRLNVQEAAAGTVKFQVSAAFSGEIKRSFAGPMTLTVNPAGPIPSIGAVAVGPASTAAGVALQATFTAVIDNGAVLPSSVVLEKLGAGGSASTVGSLHDDGLDGDAVAGDKIYSLRSTVLENTPGSVSTEWPPRSPATPPSWSPRP